MRCRCCGLTITEGFHLTKDGNICNRCWNDKNLFFPERLKEMGDVEIIFDIFSSQTNSNETLQIPALRLFQNDIVLYSSKLKAKNLLKLYSILGFEEESLQGYQRELYEGQTKEIADFLMNCPLPIMPGFFISIRDNVPFKSIDNGYENFGELYIPLRKGVLWVIDGQHRMGGFERIISNFDLLDTECESSVEINKMLNYEVPITFLDTKQALDVIMQKENIELSYSDVERLIFFIINKTQRRLSPSLKDTLQYVISEAGINGVPTIEKEAWRTEAASIGLDLNSLRESPLYTKINISGQRGLQRPMQLNTFVSSLKPLLQNDLYASLPLNEKKYFLVKYWSAIKDINQEAFSENNYRNYILLKAIGIYLLHYLALDYINFCTEKNLSFENEVNIQNFVSNMKGFNWKKDTSPLSGLGGMKGVLEARKILIDHIISINT